MEVKDDGTWQIDYIIEERHLDVKFFVTADGKQSGYRASTVLQMGLITTTILVTLVMYKEVALIVKTGR